MRRMGLVAIAGGLAAATLGEPALADCNLGNGVKYVVYIQFDNVHFTRDNPNVPSDLEQMPNLLKFLEMNGTFQTNHWTPLISHTAVDILTALTGVYGDRFGVPIGNSFRYFNPNGTSTGAGSFAYWTDPLDSFDTNPTDTTPQMIDQRGKIHPAPWVPFTRAGCDVGAFSIANIELENIGLDINTVFGPNSPEAAEAKSNPGKAATDFEGIAVHCAKGSPLCAAHSQPDLLPDEPGGYQGFSALFGNANVQPQISPGGPVKDLDGNVIQDSKGNPGFPNSFNPSASQTLGYLTTMLESRVPVVYGYISDAHDNHGAGGGTFGPGEAGYVAQLKAYDAAFGKFFARLNADKITVANTLFVVTADENDHFVGGSPSTTNCDGINIPCTYSVKGEINADLSRLLATEGEGTPFSVHSDDAPTFYINGNPGQLTPLTRRFERDVANLQASNPITGKTDQLTQAIADQQQQAFLHMVTADPRRTPNFIMFANPDYFLFTTGDTTPCTAAPPAPPCFQVQSGFAWNHGDFQPDITNTWLGMAGPGIMNLGVVKSFFSDHTDIRPTMMSLVGLTDDYAHDGRVLIEVMKIGAMPETLQQHQQIFTRLAGVYKAINAPLGTLGVNTLQNTTVAIQGNDASYIGYSAQLKALTGERNSIAGNMIRMMEASEFGGIPFNDISANVHITLGQNLLSSAP